MPTIPEQLPTEPQPFEYPVLTAEELLLYGVPDWRRLYAQWWIREQMRQFAESFTAR